MNNMESLFIALPEVFNLLEELTSYIGQVVIPVGLGVHEFVHFQSKDSMIPMNILSSLAINLITDALPSLSHSFLISMMKKHRLQLKWRVYDIKNLITIGSCFT